MTKQATVKQSAPKKPATPQKRRKIVSLDKRKARAGWWFILPFLIGFVVIYLPIIFDSIKYSFNEMTTIPGGGGFRLDFVGFENYRTALTEDPTYVTTLRSGIRQLVFDIPAIVIFSLFMAVLLNQNMFGRAAFRAIFFIPVILCTGLIDSIDSGNVLTGYMGDTSSGISTGATSDRVTQVVSVADFSRLFNNMQIGGEILTYVTGVINNIYDIINRSGVQMLVFLAGLQSISPAIYESCSIDGASGWETFWKITFPMISPMILVNAIYTVIDAFTDATNPVMTYIDTVYNEAGGQVLSSAMSWMYFLVVILIIAAVAGVMSAYIFYQKRDT